MAENVVLGDHRGVGRTFLLHRATIERAWPSSASATGSPSTRARGSGSSRVGEQQRVEILKALYREARILILDEPTAVLTPQEADSLFVTLRTMAAEGRTVIFISHKLHEVTAVADRVTVLRGGRSVGTVDRRRRRDAVARRADGRTRGRARAPAGRRRSSGDVVLEARRARRAGDRGVDALRDVSLAVRAGEVLGVAGRRRQRPARARRGGHRHAAARLRAGRVGGRRLASGDPRAAIRAGVAHVPEDRLHTGVAPSLSIASNVVLKSYRGGGVTRGPFLRLRRIRDRAVELIRRYDVRDAGPTVPARMLSGGNLQKVVLGREFSGRAAGARGRLADARARRGRDRDRARLPPRRGGRRGVAVLLISEDLDEMLALADRIVVMYEGAHRRARSTAGRRRRASSGC